VVLPLPWFIVAFFYELRWFVVVDRGRGSTTTNDFRERDSFETWEGLAEPKKLIESTLFQKLMKYALFSEVYEPNKPKFNA